MVSFSCFDVDSGSTGGAFTRLLQFFLAFLPHYLISVCQMDISVTPELGFSSCYRSQAL